MRCYDKHKRRKRARNLLNTIRYDHRFCGTCFRQTKTVDKPPSNQWGLPDCVIGFEDTTQHATNGDVTVSVDEYNRERIAGHSGSVCECGNTSHVQSEPSLQTRFAFENGVYLRRAIAELRAEGKTDETVDDDALDAALTEHLLVTGRSPRSPDAVNWELVLAAALTS